MSLQQLSNLLPLPEDELKQIISYAETLSPDATVEHFRNLLGDSPQAISFISSFNGHRKPAASSSISRGVQSKEKNSQTKGQSELDPVPKGEWNRGGKKKVNIHTPQARKINKVGPAPGATYNKKDQGFEYIPKKKSQLYNNTTTSASALGNTAASGAGSAANSSTTFDLKSFMETTSGPSSTIPSRSGTPAPAPKNSKATPQVGYLISDGPPKKSKPISKAPVAAKVNITGGLPMSGASCAVSDLDSAIRALEISTNPTQSTGKTCNCVATKHPLQTAAPNCLKCGKVICIKEGLGPCSFCGTPLLAPSDIQAMIKELQAERGRERMVVDRGQNKRAEISTTPATYAQARGGPMSDAALLARQHRDKLLGFQAQNSQRTKVVDEAADFDIGLAQGYAGGFMWSSPLERAMELKRQQKLIREMEWEAKPEYEKRRQVVSIDLVGKKVVKKIQAIQRPQTPDSDEDLEPEDEYGVLDAFTGTGGAGKFSHNPLMKGLIRPVFIPEEGSEGPQQRTIKWRRVQDDRDDNEAVILDGGAYGGSGIVGGIPSDNPANSRH